MFVRVVQGPNPPETPDSWLAGPWSSSADYVAKMLGTQTHTVNALANNVFKTLGVNVHGIIGVGGVGGGGGNTTARNTHKTSIVRRDVSREHDDETGPMGDLEAALEAARAGTMMKSVALFLCFF